MATNTKNLGLVKPEQEDFYNVDDFNENFQKLDDFAGRKDNPHGVTAQQTGALPLTGGTLTSNVKIKADWGNYQLETADGKRKAIFEMNPTKGGVHIHTLADDDNTNRLSILSETTPLKDSLMFANILNGKQSNFRIYGEHNFFIESAEHPGCYYRIVNGEQEWLNPPMEDGVAYRTVERYTSNFVSVYVYSQEIKMDSSSGTQEIYTHIPVAMDETKEFIEISGTYQGKVIGSINDGTYKLKLKFEEDPYADNGGDYIFYITPDSNITSDERPATIRVICKYIKTVG